MTAAQAFTSDLSIDELLLVEEVGFEPVDFVLGTSYFHIGWQSSGWTTNCELTDASRTMLQARLVAMERMLAHARAAQADGIVGMRLDMEREGHHAEFTAYGTAVRRRDGNGAAWRDRRGEISPFTLRFIGRRFLGTRARRLSTRRANPRHLRVSHRPRFAGASAVQLVWRSGLPKRRDAPIHAGHAYDAREIAMSRMQQGATDAGGHGLVGVQVREASHGWDSHVIEFVAVGTAITAILDSAHEVHEAPRLVLFAQDGPATGSVR